MVRSPRFQPEPPPAFPPIPRWVRSSISAEAADDARFYAGAVLQGLDPIARSEHAVGTLWRQRLALSCAAALARLQGRGEDEAAIRDHVHLARPGDDPGPAGRLFQAWRELARPGALRSEAAAARLAPLLDLDSEVATSAVSEALSAGAGQGSPIAAAAEAARASLCSAPRSRALALWIADAALARRLGWPAPVPLLASQIKRSDLREAAEPESRVAWVETCHRAYARAGASAIELHADLVRRADKLIAVAPKLRAKDADRTLGRLLSEDAQPAAAGKAASDRSGRRLFERLVQLEAVRELTGRSTFRLYGL